MFLIVSRISSGARFLAGFFLSPARSIVSVFFYLFSVLLYSYYIRHSLSSFLSAVVPSS